MRNENINLKQNSQSFQTSVSGCFGAINVKIYKIIKIFCFLIW